MNVYTTTNFTGHYPVGTAAVVVAEDSNAAIGALVELLHSLGLFAQQTADDWRLIREDFSEPLDLQKTSNHFE